MEETRQPRLLLACLAELGVSLLEAVGIWPGRTRARSQEADASHLLEPMGQHGAVHLLPDVGAYLDHQVWPDA